MNPHRDFRCVLTERFLQFTTIISIIPRAHFAWLRSITGVQRGQTRVDVCPNDVWVYSAEIEFVIAVDNLEDLAETQTIVSGSEPGGVEAFAPAAAEFARAC
jgi:hypothetical protein